jgi:hypothetical protein
MEFLTHKKLDIEVPKYFMSQLSLFETRLSKAGQGPKSNNFYDEPGDIEIDELLLRNTYLNGLPNKQERRIDRSISYNSRKLQWADNNNYARKDLLCTLSLNKDLMVQKDIKPVISHKKLKPNKSILKRSNSVDVMRKHTPSGMENFVNNYINKNKEKDNSFSNTITNNYTNMPKTPDENKSRIMNSMNRFESEKVIQKEERIKTPPSRSYSVDTREQKKAEVTNIIIAPNMKSLISNNIKNIYINNDVSDKSPTRLSNYDKMIEEKNIKAYLSSKVSGTRDTNSPLLNNSTSINPRVNVNFDTGSSFLNYNYDDNPVNKLSKSNENQRSLLQNNYIMNNNNLLEYLAFNIVIVDRLKS